MAGERTDFEQFADFIMSDDDSELGKTKAELAYALHCLEREIAICAQTQAQVDALVKALQFYADETRYLGANQWNDGKDPYTKSGAAYIQDVSRDNGEVAREALRASLPSPLQASKGDGE